MSPLLEVYASGHVLSTLTDDIREIPREKVSCIRQSPAAFMPSKTTCQRGMSWCLLAESIMELRREIKFYLSFTDEEVFRGVDLPKKEESNPKVPATADITPVADIPGATDVPEAQPIPNPTPEKKTPKYAGWEKILHPSWLVLAVSGDSRTSHNVEVEGEEPSNSLKQSL